MRGNFDDDRLARSVDAWPDVLTSAQARPMAVLAERSGLEFRMGQSTIDTQNRPSSVRSGGLVFLKNLYGGCITSVWSTPKNPEGHARQLRREVDACPHGDREIEFEPELGEDDI